MTVLEMPDTVKKHRLVFLDGIRGWAALMVVFSHILKQFLSKTNDVYQHWAFTFMTDGNFAVHVFFILSGFALSIKFIERPGHYSIAQAVSSRYFRLAIPIFVVSLIAYLMMKFGLFYNIDAAVSANSTDWLAHPFAFEPRIRTLFEFSFYKVFFKYDEATGYNTSLWTMPIEFTGSMLIFFIMAVFVPEKKNGSIFWIPILLLAVYFFRFSPPLMCFILGYFLAELYHRYKDNQHILLNWICTGLFFLPVIILTFDAPKRGKFTALLAMIMVFSIMFSKPLKAFFNSRISEFMGRISFPLYLIHLLVVCSWSSYLFLALPFDGYSHLAASNIILFSTLAISILAAWLLLPVERFSVFASRYIATKALSVTVKR